MLGDLSRGPQHPSPKKRKPIESSLADEARFIKSWFENPLRAGAVSPSGRFLARMMARYVDPRKTGPVIELGPGTGAITEALLARGVAPSRLYLIEFDPNFCRHLRRRFPGVHVIEGDAYRFRALLAGRFTEAATAVVSSLPLLVKPEKQRLTLLGDAFDCMAQDGVFIQFTYGVVSPIPRDAAEGPAFNAEPSPPVWLNLPPARVWIYRQGGDAGLKSRGRLHPAQEFFDRLRSGAERIQIDLKREFDGARARLSPKARLADAARKTKRAAPASPHKVRGGKSPRP